MMPFNIHGMIRRFFLKVALLLALLSTGAAEQRYLPSDCTALVELLPPPPAEDSTTVQISGLRKGVNMRNHQCSQACGDVR
jgi:hypothetical protein